MGLIKQGILGGFRKKTGTVVGAFWRSLDVIRALPRSSGKAPTQLQLEQQQKFGLVTAFLSNISELVDAGFKSSGPATAMNRAVAYHLKMAVTGTYPGYFLDMPKFKYSIGKLELPQNVTATAVAESKVRLEWDGITDVGKFISPTDTLTVVAYSVERQKFVKAAAITTRGTGMYEMEMPSSFVGDEVHVYISFSSTTSKRNSDSLFVGVATILEAS